MSEDVMTTQPIRQMNDYAISKWVNELQVMQSERRHGTKTVRVRLFNTYGPGEYYTPFRSVICTFIHDALAGRPYTVYLDHHRTSTYIDDCIRALAAICTNFKPGEVYNIAGDEYHDIKYISDTILAQLGKTDRLVVYVDSEKENTRNKRSDNTKALVDLGYETTISLVEGIARTIAWQKSL
jgi:dTDP-glucose 4,6-dehydratase